MDGWTGDQKCPSIFLKFIYVNKYHGLIPKMVSKVVYGFYIRSYEHFKFQNLEIYDVFPSYKTAEKVIM